MRYLPHIFVVFVVRRDALVRNSALATRERMIYPQYQLEDASAFYVADVEFFALEIIRTHSAYSYDDETIMTSLMKAF